jgi:hypothetical protein
VEGLEADGALLAGGGGGAEEGVGASLLFLLCFHMTCQLLGGFLVSQ